MKRPHHMDGDVGAVLESDWSGRDGALEQPGPFVQRGLVSRLYPLLTELWQLLDIAAAAVTLYVLALAYGTGFGNKHAVLMAIAAALMLTVYSWSDLFYRLRTRSLPQEAGRLLHAWVIVLVLLIAIGYLTQTHHHFPRDFILIWGGVAYCAQLLLHFGVRKSLHLLRRRGYNIRRALVVGCGAPLDRYVNLISKNPWLGIRIEGYIAEPEWLIARADGSHRQSRPMAMAVGAGEYRQTVASAAFQPEQTTDAARPRVAGGTLRYLGKPSDAARLVNDLSISEIYVALPLERSVDAEAAVRALVNVPVNVNWIPDFSVVQVLSTRMDELDGQPLVLLSDSRIERHGRLFKRIEDVVLSGIFILLLIPVMVAIAAAVKWTSPGPVLFKQLRLGIGGQRITVWKFRTMRVGPRGEIAKQATLADDRVTPIGRWLRRWSLDELPQLFNVLQGHMSLVGPRPHPLWLNDQFSQVIDAYMQRHRVKPGLTGWAQVNGYRGATDTKEKMEQRVKYDLYYITHWSPWLDLKILKRTITAVLFAKNAY